MWWRTTWTGGALSICAWMELSALLKGVTWSRSSTPQVTQRHESNYLGSLAQCKALQTDSCGHTDCSLATCIVACLCYSCQHPKLQGLQTLQHGYQSCSLLNFQLSDAEHMPLEVCMSFCLVSGHCTFVAKSTAVIAAVLRCPHRKTLLLMHVHQNHSLALKPASFLGRIVYMPYYLQWPPNCKSATA